VDGNERTSQPLKNPPTECVSLLRSVHRHELLNDSERKKLLNIPENRDDLVRLLYLRAGAGVDERYVQKQLGHSSAEMPDKYQRLRDGICVNLTNAAEL
jgi:integrase